MCIYYVYKICIYIYMIYIYVIYVYNLCMHCVYIVVYIVYILCTYCVHIVYIIVFKKMYLLCIYCKYIYILYACICKCMYISKNGLQRSVSISIAIARRPCIQKPSHQCAKLGSTLAAPNWRWLTC